MSIRRATLSDARAISQLLTQLDYPGTEDFLELRLAAMLQYPEEIMLVWEEPTASTSSAEPPAPATTPASPAEPPAPELVKPAPPAEPAPPPILGFLSLYFIPQIALKGDFARISYFAVDGSARSQGIGRLLEAEATRLARERGCDRLEVHCGTQRPRAHEFYGRQGYIESPKYLIKRL